MKGAKLKKCKNCETVFEFFRINVSRFPVRSNRIKAVKPFDASATWWFGEVSDETKWQK